MGRGRVMSCVTVRVEDDPNREASLVPPVSLISMFAKHTEEDGPSLAGVSYADSSESL